MKTRSVASQEKPYPRLVEVGNTDNFYLELPTNDNYFSKGLSQDIEGELEEAEN